MRRASRSALVLALLMAVAACGDDDTGTPGPAPTSAATAAIPSDPASSPADTAESPYVEEEPDPTPASGDLPDEAQSYLDQALETELGVLATAGTAAAEKKLGQLADLPENPRQVLRELAAYTWQSAQAKALYERAVSASGVSPSVG